LNSEKNNLLFDEIKFIKLKKIIFSGRGLKIKIKNLFLITIKYLSSH